MKMKYCSRHDKVEKISGKLEGFLKNALLEQSNGSKEFAYIKGNTISTFGEYVSFEEYRARTKANIDLMQQAIDLLQLINLSYFKEKE